ncbi:MAG: toll/interleukin-1 receptor domain-containing protein [Ruminiclostridium sp.]|nr:toll/interleukin-1 receptor domain-containing protein [Ruminiclostridium sp.]
MKYDVFISYRRDGGEQSAKAICDKLTDKGYKVFLDVEALRSGAFNEKLYSVIEQSQDVIVILSPNSLDRCVNDEDWFRLEIAHALKCKKNVIPIMLRGFTFPETLPEEIDILRYQNGIPASIEFFDAFIDKLTSFFKSKPLLIGRLTKSNSWRRSLFAVVGVLLLGLGVWGGSILLKNYVYDQKTYPVSIREKNDVKDLLYYEQINLTILDTMYYTYREALKSCEDYLRDPSAPAYQELVSYLENAREQIQNQSGQVIQLSDALSSALSDTEVDIANVKALADLPGFVYTELDDIIVYFKKFLDPDLPLDMVTRHRIVEIDKELLQLDADFIFLSTCELLLPIDERVLEDFRSKFLPSLSVISEKMQLWTRDETTLKAQLESIETKQDNLMREYATLVGDTNKDFLAQKDALINLLVASGLTMEEAQNQVNGYMAKAQNVDNLKDEVETLQERLEKEKQALKEKCKPLSTDAPYLVWGKALRLLKVGMYEDSIEVFQFYLNMVRNTDPQAEIYVPAAIRFIKNIGETGIDYGILVTGYETDKPQNPYYQIGDIIIAVDNNVCETYDDFVAIRQGAPADENFTVTILRADENGMLKAIDIQMETGKSRVVLMDLKEADIDSQ